MYTIRIESHCGNVKRYFMALHNITYVMLKKQLCYVCYVIHGSAEQH